MYLLNILRRFKRNSFDPSKHLLRIELDTKAFEHNISQFKTLFPHQRLAVVLKSNAYGHGLKEVGRFLDKNRGVDYFVVDSIIEAVTLRDVGVKKPVIILGYVPRASLGLLKKIRKATLVINTREQADVLQAAIDFPLRVHVKVDTGMNRQGIAFAELEYVLRTLHSNKRISIEGMLSHLADADGPGGAATQEQIRDWRMALDLYKKYTGQRHGLFHFAATAGTRYVSAAENNLIRAGIGIYGFDTTQDKRLGVRPVLSFRAKIVNIKDVPKGQKIGYNFTFTAPRDMKVAVIPCGYYEGMPRALSNRGVVYYKDYALPIVGRVSMNLTVVDITDVGEPLHVEDEVEVYSSNPGKLNSVSHIAELCDTIPYEILVRLAPTIKRIFT